MVEVAHARQACAQARLAQVRAKGAAQNDYVALIAAMGISPLTQLKVAEETKRQLPLALAESADRIVAAAMARRPDVLAAYAAQKVSEANSRVAETEYLPKFFLSATGAYNSGDLSVSAIPSIGQQTPTLNVAGSHWGTTVLLGVTMPIYDGGSRSATLDQARAGVDKANATFTRVRDAAAQQIVVAQNALETSLAAHEAATALEAAAQTTFDAALDAYRHGVGTITDATATETQLLQAHNAASDAYSSVLSAATTLAFATGALGAAPEVQEEG